MDKLLVAQKNEITEHYIYSNLAKIEKNPKNKKILESISKDELGHYNIFKKYTKQEIKPSSFKIFKTLLASKILGITFAIKQMENGEKKAQISYERIKEAKNLIKDENHHEKELIKLIDEERLNYVSSVVLGLNDALVELTSTLAGLTLAMQNTRLIAITGLITGIAASLSMGASEYLSAKAEKGTKDPLKALVYTGSAYILAVIMLISPYFLIKNIYVALTVMFTTAIIIIMAFTYYNSVARDQPFVRKFFEMAIISLSIAGFTFLIGYIIRIVFNIQV